MLSLSVETVLAAVWSFKFQTENNGKVLIRGAEIKQTPSQRSELVLSYLDQRAPHPTHHFSRWLMLRSGCGTSRFYWTTTESRALIGRRHGHVALMTSCLFSGASRGGVRWENRFNSRFSHR